MSGGSRLVAASPGRRRNHFSSAFRRWYRSQSSSVVLTILHDEQALFVNMIRSRVLPTLVRARPSVARAAPTLVRFSSGHAQESFEAFNERYVNFFQSAQDLFEVQRGLNNCFAHDLVPAPSVIEAALRASRRVNDYATTVRVFEGIKEKVENKQQYQAYLDELKGVREELGMYFAYWLVKYDPLIIIPQLPAGINIKEELFTS